MRRLAATLLLASVAFSGCVSGRGPGSDDVDGNPLDKGGFSDTHVFPGTYDTTGAFSKPSAAGTLAMRPPFVETLRSRLDGADIPIGVFRPDLLDALRVPVVLMASPYFDELTPAHLHTGNENPDLPEIFASHGYAVAYVPTRGTANAGGCMNLMGPDERADLQQAIEWLGTQPWSSGAIGMMGFSFDGATQWEAASLGTPYLRAIVPMSGFNDLWFEQFHNGSVRRDAPYYTTLWYMGVPYLPTATDPANGRSPTRIPASAVCPDAWNGIGASPYAAAMDRHDPNGFWDARNLRPAVEENYRGGVLVVHGLRDRAVTPMNEYPWVTQLEARGVVVKHLLGQWAHELPDSRSAAGGNGGHLRWDFSEILLHWFDYWLKGDASVDLGPVAQVEDNSGSWRSESSWPPRDSTPATFFLGPEASLSARPSSSMATVTLAPDARTSGMQPPTPGPGPCAACGEFETTAFDAEFRFAGLPRLDLTVTPFGPSGHVAAFLYVSTGDAAQIVGEAQVDLRYASGGDEPKAVSVGQPMVAHLLFEPLDVVVPAGGRLGLIVSEGSIENHSPSLPTAPIQVAAGGDASRLIVDAIERGPDAFFVPPGQT